MPASPGPFDCHIARLGGTVLHHRVDFRIFVVIAENHMPRGGFAELSCKGHVLAMGQFLITKEDHSPL